MEDMLPSEVGVHLALVEEDAIVPIQVVAGLAVLEAVAALVEQVMVQAKDYIVLHAAVAAVAALVQL